MKTRYLFILGLISAGPAAFAQYNPSYPPPPPPQSTQPPATQPQYGPQYGQPQYGQPNAQQYPTTQYPSATQYPPAQYQQPSPYGAPGFSPQQLGQLVSPIALYPDPLLGAILPASTYPDQVAAAANFAASNQDPSQIDQQPWDDSVKTLAHYPSVAEWMAQNPEWTQQLGAAVATDEPSVLNAIQQLRANAQASGMLVDTPQERVVDENNQIAILPAQPNVVYVPTYNPQWIESAPPPGTRFSLSFGPAFRLGDWDHFDLDWNRHSIARGDRDEGRQFATREEWQPPREVRMRDRDEAFSRRQNWVAQPQPFNARRDEHRELAPTGRVNSPAMEYNQPARERQPEVQYNRRLQPQAQYNHEYNRGQPQARSERDQRHEAKPQNNRTQDRRDHRGGDDD